MGGVRVLKFLDTKLKARQKPLCVTGQLQLGMSNLHLFQPKVKVRLMMHELVCRVNKYTKHDI